MKLTKLHKEILFYTLQIFGWFGISITIVLFPGFSKTFALYVFLTGGLSGILATSVYRIYLKKNVDFEVFGNKSVYKLLFALIACSGLYHSVINIFDAIYEKIWVRTAVELEWIADHSGVMEITIDRLVTILLWTIIYFVIKFILAANNNRIEQINLNTILKDAQLNTLKGQVNPHFLFNSLNNIRGLILEDVDKSREMITKLSEMLEYALAKNTVDLISLEEELEMVENYVALSKIQMEDRLQYVEHIDQETRNLSIPPMIIQLLVENAAKHGISNLVKGGTISLTVKKENEELCITVANTGTLKIASDSTQLGLKNIRERLRLLYGKRAMFSLEEIENNVIAKIKIPLV